MLTLHQQNKDILSIIVFVVIIKSNMLIRENLVTMVEWQGWQILGVSHTEKFTKLPFLLSMPHCPWNSVFSSMLEGVSVRFPLLLENT